MTEQQKTKIVPLRRGDAGVLEGYMMVLKKLEQPEVVTRGPNKGKTRTEKFVPVDGVVVGELQGREVVNHKSGRVIHIRGEDRKRPLVGGQAGTDGGVAIQVAPDKVILPGLGGAVLTETQKSKVDGKKGKPRAFFGTVNNGRTKLLWTEFFGRKGDDDE